MAFTFRRKAFGSTRTLPLARVTGFALDCICCRTHHTFPFLHVYAVYTHHTLRILHRAFCTFADFNLHHLPIMFRWRGTGTLAVGCDQRTTLPPLSCRLFSATTSICVLQNERDSSPSCRCIVHCCAVLHSPHIVTSTHVTGGASNMTPTPTVSTDVFRLPQPHRHYVRVRYT